MGEPPAGGQDATGGGDEASEGPDVGGLNRCPYCHERVDAADPESSFACEKCLARHHAACWRELGKCGSCGGATPMSSHQEPEKLSGEPIGRSPEPVWNVLGPVFYPSAALILGLTIVGFVFSTSMESLFETIQAGIATYSGWFYVLTMNLVVGAVVFLLCSRFGSIRLGGQDAEPDFGYVGWFAMLFSAGMGIGLLFYSVAEPMFHYVAGPPGMEPGSAEAARHGMGLAFLHWGLHPWAVYSLVGLALAFFAYNRGAPLTIRAVFYPLLGERIHGPIGHVIDVLATVATLFGVATSLGLGVQQVNAGLDYLFGIGQSAFIQLLLISGITGLATISVIKGLDGGIRRVSELNIYLASALLVFVLILGPTLFILNAFVENLGYYFQNLPTLATWNETYEATDWQNGWTVFYWGWWIAWSPFVGMFIARVSRGRTIREFLLSVLFVPSLITFFWLTVFGDTALNIEMFGAGGIAKQVQDNIPVSLFVLLEQFPLSFVTSSLAVAVVISFFVTSSDSGSMVIDIITAGGDPEPPVAQRVFWAVTEGAVAALLLLGGGLVALQSAAIATGMPFALVLILLTFSLIRGLHEYAPTPEEARGATDAVASPYATAEPGPHPIETPSGRLAPPAEPLGGSAAADGSSDPQPK